jgi:predicted nucleic acid-binding protein
MPYLVDTNLLLRAAQPQHPMNPAATQALEALRRRGEQPCVIPQNLIEFWAVATRPIERNGLGMTAGQAEAEITQLEALFRVLPDAAEIYPEWRRLVTTHAVLGLNVHDARLVAAMKVHHLTHLLTFNVADFRRYGEITVVSPDELSP